jgi:hypothetical protein
MEAKLLYQQMQLLVSYELIEDVTRNVTFFISLKTGGYDKAKYNFHKLYIARFRANGHLLVGKWGTSYREAYAYGGDGNRYWQSTHFEVIIK